METWTVEKIQLGHWLFTWDGDSGETFYIWLNGVLLDTVEGGEYDFAKSGYEEIPPPLEIVPDESYTYADNDLYPPFTILQWREVSEAVEYLIERYVSGSWTTYKRVTDRGAGWYWCRTPVLEDQTEEQFRVSAVNVNGDPGTPISFTFEIVRNPSPPEVEYEIDSIGDLIVSEA